jgi:hypothetical protein
VPADGTGAANQDERRLRNVSALWAAFKQAGACSLYVLGARNGKHNALTAIYLPQAPTAVAIAIGVPNSTESRF